MQEHECDSFVLGLLTERSASPWKLKDVANEVGHAVEAEDGIDRLVRNGLAYRMGEDFVVPSATGRYVGQIRAAH